MLREDVTSWGNQCFETVEDGARIDEVKIYHPRGRRPSFVASDGILVYADSIEKSKGKKDIVTWYFVNRDDFSRARG